MNHSTKFWDKIAESYSKQPVIDKAAYEKKLQISQEYFQADMEVLEFGCGTGSTALIHAHYVKHIRTIDLSSKMIEIAQDKADAQNIKGCDSFGSNEYDIRIINDKSTTVVLTAKNVLDEIGL